MATKYNTINNLLKNPSDITDVVSNPGKFGLDFWDELSNKERSYLAFAAAAGLALYGVYLSRQKG